MDKWTMISPVIEDSTGLSTIASWDAVLGSDDAHEPHHDGAAYDNEFLTPPMRT